MIFRKRPETTPGPLQRNAGRWTRELLAARSKKQKKRISNRYRHPEVKSALVDLFDGKCAYCESKITHIEYGHIEHYRPKSTFPEKTFEWSNLLLACGVCNGTAHKGGNFPGEDEDGPILNPCEDEPDEHLEFRFDPVAGLASVYETTPRGKTTRDLLGLNRPELRKHRSVHVNMLYVLAKDSRPEARTLFEKAQEDGAQYAAFARALRAFVDR